MKKFFAIVTLIVITLQAFSSAVIVAEYYANKAYIAKNLCENRNKPSLHCDGKCCLKKKLAKEGKEQAPSSTRNQKNEDGVTLFFSDDRIELPYIISSQETKDYPGYTDMHLAAYHRAIFHPPSATA